MAGKSILKFLIAIWLLLIWLPGQTQNRCSTVEYELMRRSPKSKRETVQQFEQWMQGRILQNRLKPPTTIMSSTITIPVVVHVIHNGTADITNITDAQILSQIDVLNKDFKRLNLDAINTPLQFQSVAGSMDIEFVLAKQNPEGIATNGITRTVGTKTQWTLADQSEFKALNYWAAENYLNIWVIKFSTGDIGFAQLPVSSTLPGLEEASADRLTDGIVVDYRAFGTDALSFPFLFSRFDKGRTATHEIGHFFGLRHIWGDINDCSPSTNFVGDYVTDTPVQNAATTFCPPHPQPACGGTKMFMNYMDYTDDRCMNIFSAGQVARMQIILAESPRRASLTTSPGASDPVPVANDLGIRTIITPGTSICNNPVTPQIEVRNYGSNPVSSAQIQMSVNSIIIETTTFPLTLSPGDISLLSFSPLNFSPGSTQQVSFQVVQTNGGSDGLASNNQLSVGVSVPTTFSLPVAEFFNTTPTSWIISNPDGQTTWTNVVAPDNMQTNRAMSIEFYNYQNEGATDRLMTPSFTLTDPSNAQLRFDIAYAMYPGITGDGLKVYALRGCNPDLSQAILLYDKSGSSLATAPTTSNAFTPANATQWRKPEILSLGLLTGADAWQIAFIGRNGYGNNLYLDNAIITENEFNDITITGVASPGIVHCNPEPVVSFYVSNFGSTTVFSFDVSYTVNSGNNFTKHFSNAQLGVGQQKLFALDPVSLQDGYSTIVITVSNPNGVPDISNNNTISFTNIVDTSTDKPPLRMTFDNPSEVPWQIASPSDQLDWESVSTSKQQSITYKSFTNSSVGEESWLVSPILDFSWGTYSLFFDASYAQKIPADDRLRIVASTDCGLTYNLVIMDYAASIFSVAPKFTEWFPETDEDWKKQYVSLEALAGKQNVRIALVAHNNNGNNLFLDNIEFFAGDDPNPPLTTVPYQFYYSEQNSNSDLAITFSLSKKSDVRVQIYGMQGNVIQDTLLPGTLNQTYYYDFSEQSPGIYLFRLQIDNHLSTAKVFITH